MSVTYFDDNSHRQSAKLYINQRVLNQIRTEHLYKLTITYNAVNVFNENHANSKEQEYYPIYPRI